MSDNASVGTYLHHALEARAYSFFPCYQMLVGGSSPATGQSEFESCKWSCADFLKENNLTLLIENSTGPVINI